jgi:Right handed beta helix region
MKKYVALTLTIALCILAPVAPAQGIDRCRQITSMPYTITIPGNYCLRSNLYASDFNPRIAIESSDVTLDCQGNALIHTVANNGDSAVVAGERGKVANVVVRNCKIIDFGSGIWFGPGSYKIQILNNDIIHPRYEGITLWAKDSSIIGNRLIDGRNAPGQNVASGINIVASEPGVPSTGNLISRNLISGFADNRLIFGIRVSFSNDTIVSENHIVDLRPNTDGYSTAIDVQGTNAQIINNLFRGQQGLQYGIGGFAALCTRNVAIGMDNDGFDGCTTAISNHSLP